jgi:hypothetical protein
MDTHLIVNNYFQVIDAYIGDLAIRCGNDRHICPAWRSKFLLDLAAKGYRQKKKSCNNDHAIAKSATVRRVVEEYFISDKVNIIIYYYMLKVLQK